MKAINHLLALTASVFVAAGCYEEVNVLDPNEEKSEVAVQYYENLGEIVDAVFTGKPLSETAKSSQIYAKLEALPIVNAEGRSVSFFDLSAEEQSAFFKEYASLESAGLQDKLASAPELTSYIEGQNTIMKETMEEFGATKGGDFDSDAFLNALTARAAEFAANYEIPDAPATKSANVKDPKNVLRKWAGVAKKGDFVLALAKHDHPLVINNNDEEGRWKQGHAEIICTDIKSSMTLDDKVSVGTLKDGVAYHSINECWTYKNYILGLEIYDLKWERLRLRRVKRNINTADIAEYAKNYLGYPYVSDDLFYFTKYTAPQSFSCASLCWWITKQLYDVDFCVTWLLPMVAPADLYLSEYTVIKTSVDE